MNSSNLSFEYSLTFDEINALMELIVINENQYIARIDKNIDIINSAFNRNLNATIQKVPELNDTDYKNHINMIRNELMDIITNYMPITHEYIQNKEYSKADYFTRLSIDYLVEFTRTMHNYVQYLKDDDINIIITNYLITNLVGERINIHSNNSEKNKSNLSLLLNTTDIRFKDGLYNNAIFICKHIKPNFTEYFINLKSLELICTDITRIDLSNNEKLEKLILNRNKLTDIDLSKNVLLRSLILSNNRITSIDLSKNILLELLDLSKNELHTLDLRKNTKLIRPFLFNHTLETIHINQDVLRQTKFFDTCKKTEIVLY